MAYPTVTLAGTPLEAMLSDPAPMDQNELEAGRAKVRATFPADLEYLPPGTGFGPLTGRATGAVPDLAWSGAWYLLSRPETLRDLSKLARVPVMATSSILSANDEW